MKIELEFKTAKEIVSIFEAFAKGGQHISMNIALSEEQAILTATENGDVVQYPCSFQLLEQSEDEESIVLEIERFIMALHKLTAFEQEVELEVKESLLYLSTKDGKASIKMEICELEAMEVCIMPESNDMLINTCIESKEFSRFYKKGGYISKANADFMLQCENEEYFLSIITQDAVAIIANAKMPLTLHPLYQEDEYKQLLIEHQRARMEYMKENNTEERIFFAIAKDRLERIAKIILNSDETIAIAIFKKHIMFQTQSVSITTPLESSEATFFNGIETLMKINKLAEIEVEQTQLLQALTVIGIEGKSKMKLNMRIEQKDLVLTSQNESAAVKIEIKKEIGDVSNITKYFSVEYLEKAVSHLEKNTICIQFPEGKEAIFLFNGKVNDSFKNGTVLCGLNMK